MLTHPASFTIANYNFQRHLVILSRLDPFGVAAAHLMAPVHMANTLDRKDTKTSWILQIK